MCDVDLPRLSSLTIPDNLEMRFAKSFGFVSELCESGVKCRSGVSEDSLCGHQQYVGKTP